MLTGTVLPVWLIAVPSSIYSHFIVVQENESETVNSSSASADYGVDAEEEEDVDPLTQWHPNNPYQVRTDLPNILSESLF